MGPKKGGGNRGASTAKKSSKPPQQREEISISDFVAAGEDGKGKGKGKGKEKDAPGNAEDADQPKKPTARSVIGGASWTGKLPVNLLSEHCQKQKWERPEYTMVLPRIYEIACPVLTDDTVQNCRWFLVQRDPEKVQSEDERDDCSSTDALTPVAQAAWGSAYGP